MVTVPPLTTPLSVYWTVVELISVAPETTPWLTVRLPVPIVAGLMGALKYRSSVVNGGVTVDPLAGLV